jgi:hypothetical protein
MMIIETLKTLFSRDLNRLKKEIESYQNESAIWEIEKNIANSAGNLCLHLIGNLNAYIGAGIAKTGYIRQRNLEFSLKNMPREELLKKIDDTLQVVEAGLNALGPENMEEDFPVVVWDKPTGMEYTLVHLTTHLNYHLGQINYHRRLLDN